MLRLTQHGANMPTKVHHSKRYRKLTEKRKEEALSIADAVNVLKNYAGTKFDQTVDIAIRLGVDQAQADQIVRGSIVLPHGLGKQNAIRKRV